MFPEECLILFFQMLELGNHAGTFFLMSFELQVTMHRACSHEEQIEDVFVFDVLLYH